MNLETAKMIVEALIFASSEPLSAKTIAEVSTIDLHTVNQLIAGLMADYNQETSALQIAEVAGGYQFCTNLAVAPYLEKLQKIPRQVGLSPAAIETLAIIAYKQPVTKAEIESLRGVSAESSLATLLEKRLVAEVGRKETPGRPILYGTTAQFLKHFGLKGLHELPLITNWQGEETALAYVGEPKDTKEVNQEDVKSDQKAW